MTRKPAHLKGRLLETMTWKDAEPILAAGPIMLLPIGARLKEHGLHLPLNNDWLLAEYLTRRVLEATEVLALPTLQHSHYPAFVDYPGSVSLGVETSCDTILDIIRSLSRHGPRKFYLLNTGVSTLKILATAKGILAREGILIEYTNILTAATDAERKVRTQPAGTHADEIETSMMLYIDPAIVRMELAKRDIHPVRGPGPLSRDPAVVDGLYSPTGVWGDPTLATAEKGHVIVEALVAAIVREIEDMRETPLPA